MFAGLSPGARDVLCVVFLYAVTLVLFRGIIFDNAGFASGGDTATALSYIHTGATLQEKEHRDILWMPNFFSGMPTFGPVAYVPRNVDYLQTYLQQALNLLYFNGRWTWYIVYFLIGGTSMFFFVRVLNFSRAAALLAALTFMLSPYAMGLPTEGHGTKLMALSYLPLVMMLTHLLFERRTLLTFALLAAAIGTLFLTNHMQIVYYVLMLVGCYLIYTIVMDFSAAKKAALKKTALLAGALAIGICMASYIYLSVYEYSQFSMRGGGTAGSTGGLAFDYATNWSWSLWEAIVLLIPGFYGISGLQSPYYWGHVEPWTNASVYVGLIPIILAVVALRERRTAFTIFVSIVTLVVIVISLGRNFPFVYDALFSVLPFFNKFRAPMMILHALPFLVGLLGAVGYDAIEELARRRGKEAERLMRGLAYAAAGAGGLLLLSFVFKETLRDILSGFLFLREGEVAELQRQYGTRTQSVITQIKQIRFDIFWKDYLKFLLLAAAGTGVAAMYLKRNLRPAFFSILMVILVLVDLMVIDNKLITPQPAGAVEQSFRMDETTKFLKDQPGLFRIFPLGQDLFMDNSFAYFGLQSIGGYSPAKLKIYQTMLDSCMYHGPDPEFPLNMNVVDMLNVKYLVGQFQLPPDRFRLVHVDQARRLNTYENPGALPRAFFVDTVLTAPGDEEVFRTLNSPTFNPAKEAIVHGPFTEHAGKSDSTSAAVTKFESSEISIQVYTASPALLVLSEVYYPAGWSATIDGQPATIYRTDDILRSVVVPAGAHTVDFTFAPKSYALGLLLSHSAWGLTALLLLAGLWYTPSIRQRLFRRRPAAETPDPLPS